MSNVSVTYVEGIVVEDEVQLTLVELCQACHAEPELVLAWVEQGVLEPLAPSAAQAPHDWRFAGNALRRARVARHLSRDLEVNPAGVALALELLGEITELRARLQSVESL
ncbi:MAG: chaperone modulator CbpM [Gammaproteobacteria bacterium]